MDLHNEEHMHALTAAWNPKEARNQQQGYWKRRLERAAHECNSDNFQRGAFTYVYRAAFQDALMCTQASVPCSDALFMYTFMVRLVHFLKRPRQRLLVAGRHVYLSTKRSGLQYLTDLIALDQDLKNNPVDKRVISLVDQCTKSLLLGINAVAVRVYSTTLAQAVTNGRPEAWQSIVNRATTLFFVGTAQSTKASVPTELDVLVSTIEKGISDHFESTASLLCMAHVIEELIAHVLN
jgi:hypothetical protein